MNGIADLPLHKGHVPKWMLNLMKKLAEKIVEIIVLEYGPSTLIEGLKDPIWFQAFNNIIGMDWDSSGSTTVVTGILKDITWKKPELGFLVLGGKGLKSLNTPNEILVASELFGLSENKTEYLIKASRLSAKADVAFLQDKYELYHHSLLVDENGNWVIIQQGMNTEKKMARRYHIDKISLIDIHRGIIGIPEEKILLNLTIKDATGPLKNMIDLSHEPTGKIIRLLNEANSMIQPNLFDFTETTVSVKNKRKMGYYIPIKPSKKLIKGLENLYEYKPRTPEELALVKGAGPATIRALALISDLIYNIPSPDKDNVTHIDPYYYSYAVGGKDGIPYKFNKRISLKTIEILEYAIESAKIGDKEKIRALKKMRTMLEWWRKHGF